MLDTLSKGGRWLASCCPISNNNTVKAKPQEAHSSDTEIRVKLTNSLEQMLKCLSEQRLPQNGQNDPDLHIYGNFAGSGQFGEEALEMDTRLWINAVIVLNFIHHESEKSGKIFLGNSSNIWHNSALTLHYLLTNDTPTFVTRRFTNERPSPSSPFVISVDTGLYLPFVLLSVSGRIFHNHHHFRQLGPGIRLSTIVWVCVSKRGGGEGKNNGKFSSTDRTDN